MLQILFFCTQKTPLLCIHLFPLNILKLLPSLDKPSLNPHSCLLSLPIFQPDILIELCTFIVFHLLTTYSSLSPLWSDFWPYQSTEKCC